MDLPKLPDLHPTNAPLITMPPPLACAAVRKTGVTKGTPASDHEALL